MTSSPTLLVAEELVVGFGRERVLRGASITVADGEIVSVMGRSGSGKSTLLFCLAGLLTPVSGSVSFRGRTLDAEPERARSALRLRQFGFVFQFGDLVPELSVVENVELPLRFAGVASRAARQQAIGALERLGVDSLSNRRTYEVSGGELQRVAVARGLVHNPRVVFADEPTGALDEHNGELVLGALIGAARERGSAVVLVTHDESVADVADRVVFMRDGLVEPAPIAA